jgi:hypothetical protein
MGRKMGRKMGRPLFEGEYPVEQYASAPHGHIRTLAVQLSNLWHAVQVVSREPRMSFAAPPAERWTRFTLFTHKLVPLCSCTAHRSRRRSKDVSKTHWPLYCGDDTNPWS